MITDEIEQRAKDAEVSISTVLARAEIAQTTWWRWREGHFEPRLSTLRRINTALDAVIAEQRAA